MLEDIAAVFFLVNKMDRRAAFAFHLVIQPEPDIRSTVFRQQRGVEINDPMARDVDDLCWEKMIERGNAAKVGRKLLHESCQFLLIPAAEIKMGQPVVAGIPPQRRLAREGIHRFHHLGGE